MFTHFYTFLHMCKWIFLGLHMCKWNFVGLHMCKWIFFGLHMCKWIFVFDSYTSLHIHTHPYAFRYIVVFLVHAFVQWHHMICFSILQNDCGPMDCISSCISCNELTRDKHVYWFKSAAHWIAYLYNSLVNQKHIVGVYVSSREVAGTDNSCSEAWTMKRNRIWMPRRTPLVIRGCSILRPFGQQLSHLFFPN